MLLIKYKKIWSEMKTVMKRKKFDSDPVFGGRYLKTKIKSCNKKITTNFHGRAPKLKCLCVSVIVIDSVFKLGKKYYRQTFLEECKYKAKEQVLKLFIIEDVGNSDDNDDNSKKSEKINK